MSWLLHQLLNWKYIQVPDDPRICLENNMQIHEKYQIEYSLFLDSYLSSDRMVAIIQTTTMHESFDVIFKLLAHL
jgi:hypothetical protein